jgi:hypothetical protein
MPLNLYRCTSCRELMLSPLSTRVGRCSSCLGRVAPVWMPRAPRARPGSYPERETTWASMEDFLEADERRLHSREVDFGVLWRRPGSRVTHRAAWIEETGELYLVQAGPTGSGGGHVELLAVTDRNGIERGLAGWEPASRRPGGLAWLLERVAGLRRLGVPAAGFGGF